MSLRRTWWELQFLWPWILDLSFTTSLVIILFEYWNNTGSYCIWWAPGWIKRELTRIEIKGQGQGMETTGVCDTHQYVFLFLYFFFFFFTKQYLRLELPQYHLTPSGPSPSPTASITTWWQLLPPHYLHNSRHVFLWYVFLYIIIFSLLNDYLQLNYVQGW